MTRKSTLEEFIQKAIEIHGEKYDYSMIKEYVNNHTKVSIKCNTCNIIFEQAPNTHLNNGCFNCSGKKRKTLENFIKESKKIHGDIYDYSFIKEYKNNTSKVSIKCNICGNIFLQTPKHHTIRRQGCSFCKGSKTKTLEEFIQQAKKFTEKNMIIAL